MPERAEELYRRALEAADADGRLPTPPLDERETFPFEGREIGRVHVGRWGDGSAHLHFWFIARPARMPQLRTSFAAIWDDILPPLAEPLWRENLAIVARTLAESGGRARV